MGAMIEQPDFTSFRPGIARAIAQTRDGKQCAGRPELILTVDTAEEVADHFKAKRMSKFTRNP